MSEKLYTYAFIKAVFDQDRDFFDTLSPLVLESVDSITFNNLTRIQENLKSKYHIEIPVHILKTICSRAKKNRYLEQEESKRLYKITSKGENYLKQLEPSSEVRRRTNSLLLELVNYFKSNDVEINQGKALELVDLFIQHNLDGIIDFVNPKEAKSMQPNLNKLPKQESALLIGFIKQIQDSNPETYKQFTELVFGSIIASLLYSESSSDIIEAGSKKMKKSSIFFDTNITFSLLGYHSDESNLAAKELFKLLSDMGFQLKIFDFTLDEMSRVMNGYISNKHRFPSELPVDHIYSTLKKLKWGSSDVSDFISNIEDIVEKMGVEVIITDIVLRDYTSLHNESLRSKISANKKNDNRGLSTSHDLAAVDEIRKIRKKSVRRIEDAEAFFLTSDFALQKIILFELGHKEGGTLSEVILDRVLSNILWLKNPNLNLPLNTIIATHSRDLLIDRKIWDKFYIILGKLRKDGKVTGGQIDNLFYHNNISNILQEFKQNDTDKVDDDLVLDAVEEAVETISDEEKKQLEEKESVEKELFESQTEQDKKIQEHNAQIILIKKGLRHESVATAKIWSIIIVILFIVIAFFIEVQSFVWLLDNLPERYLNLLSSMYGGLGIFALSGTFAVGLFLQKKMSKYLQPKIYASLLEKVHLHDKK